MNERKTIWEQLVEQKAKYIGGTLEDFGDLSCGRSIAELLRPSIAIAREEFNKIWKRIKVLDPKAPNNPYLRESNK